MNGVAQNGSQPAHTRLRNVGSDGFDYQIEEWDYLDGYHIAEKACYLAAEEGVHRLPGGTALEAGAFSGRNLWRDVSFEAGFDRTPVVLSQPQTYNGSDAVVARLRSVSADGFDAFLQEQDSKSYHATESIGYVAVEEGTDTLGGKPMEAGLTAQRVTDDWHRIEFERTYSDPNFVAACQTFNGWNAVSVRYRSLTGSGVDVRLQEEQSADAETTHSSPKRVGFVVAEDA